MANNTSKKPVVIFLCTPRSGTQWFAKNLNEIYSDKIEVTHEPILYDYYPRLNLWKFDSDLQPKDNGVLEKHLNYIDKVTEDKIYVEIGWESIAGISELYNRFSDRLKLVHLVRHPVNVAASLVTHNWYSSELHDRAEKAELKPFDEGAQLTFYSGIWDSLNEFEKCLYYWTEVNLCALTIKNRLSDLPFYQLKFENVFKKNKETSRLYLSEMLAFIGLDFDERFLDRLDKIFDEYRNVTNKKIDSQDINSHKQTVELAKKLGYKTGEKKDLSRYKKSKNYTRRIINKAISIIKMFFI